MNLSFVGYFLAVVEAGHFTRAAQRLNVTQPTLSAGIARLEEALGARLFDRQRGVALTEAGRRFLPQAQAMTEAWAAARATLRQAPASRRVLRLGLLPTLPDRVALALATRLAADGRMVDVLEAPANTLRERLRRGQLDAALTLLGPGTGAAATRALHREAYLVALPSMHPLAGHSRVTIADLASTAFVLRSHCEAHAEARKRFAAAGVRPPVVARTASDARALALVAAGMGACLVPESLVGTDVDAVGVAELKLERRLGLLPRAGLDTDLAELMRDAGRALPWAVPRPDTVIAH